LSAVVDEVRALDAVQESEAIVPAAEWRKSEHFRARLLERYGLECQPADYLELLALVRDAAGIDDVFRSRRWVEWRGARIHVVYDRMGDVLVTALTP
jgi:hypothetical protein